MDTTTRPTCPECNSSDVNVRDFVSGEIRFCRKCRSKRERLALAALANLNADLQDALRFLTVHEDPDTAEAKIRDALGRCQEVFEDWGSA